MNNKLQEFAATLITITTLVGLPALIFRGAPWKTTDDQPVIHLTALKKSGIWTQSEVNGLTYWWKSFQPRTLVLREGEPVRLRLTSSDVTHSFYVPELFPEPIIVKAGFTEEMVLVPKKSGEYTYYCITVCGECHYMMRGTIRVLPADAPIDETARGSAALTCTHESTSPESKPLLARGKFLFHERGCYTCHGDQGQGGVYNPNYVSQYVPQLNTLAERMKLYWEEDADTIITLLEKGADLESLAADPPIDGYHRFLAQYGSIRDKIRNGSPQVQKLDREGPEPPLTMPSWEYQLTDRDIDALIAYLLSLYPWEEWD
jgi:mono/diheme cytochrome c family protein